MLLFLSLSIPYICEPCTGFMAVPGAAVGQFLGGYLCKRFELKVPDILKLTTTCSVIILLLSPIFWAKCVDADFAGVTIEYPGSVRTFSK